MPTHLDGSNKNRFRPRAAIFKEQKERIASLVSKMDETSEAEGALPRDDYRFMLNLVAVREIPFIVLITKKKKHKKRKKNTNRWTD